MFLHRSKFFLLKGLKNGSNRWRIINDIFIKCWFRFWRCFRWAERISND
jgi:hypothetical protein